MLTAHRSAREARLSFDEVSLGMREDEARREALRCLNCGLCSECMECVRVCERNAIDHSMQEVTQEIKVGNIVIATGFDILNPAPLKLRPPRRSLHRP